MKYILLVPDGATDDPLPELDGRTPMQVARTPYLDGLARSGSVGSVHTVPEGMYPGSDVANMALLGYEPARYYTGRGPLEAAALQVPLAPRDVAYRCSLVATDGECMVDYAAGHVTTEEARVLIGLLQQKLGSRRFAFYPGVQYRHVLRWTDGKADVRTTPPHDIMGQPLQPHYPVGDGEDALRQLIQDSFEILNGHPVNRGRRDAGKHPANMAWPWGPGRATALPDFFRTRGLRGVMITAVDLLRGLARCAGLQVVDVPGATGYIDTNYRGKAHYALSTLDAGADFVYIHVEAPDESGHEGNIDHKIGSLEDIDRELVGPLLDGLKERQQPFRILVVPDHATPIALRTHRPGPVPFLLFDTRRDAGNVLPFDERALEETRLRVEEGHLLIDLLLEK